VPDPCEPEDPEPENPKIEPPLAACDPEKLAPVEPPPPECPPPLDPEFCARPVEIRLKETKIRETKKEKKLRGRKFRLERAIEAKVEYRTRSSYSNPVLMAHLEGKNAHTLLDCGRSSVEAGFTHHYTQLCQACIPLKTSGPGYTRSQRYNFPKRAI
jgi:hypothetical protein